MGFLSSLKRWFNRNDAYGQFASVNRRSLFMSRDRMGELNKPILAQMNDGEEEEPAEGLMDAELDSHTSKEAIASREAAIEHERRLRESR